MDGVATKKAIGMCPRFYAHGLILDFCFVLKRAKGEFRFKAMVHTGLARELGLEPRFSEDCCSLIFEELS